MVDKLVGHDLLSTWLGSGMFKVGSSGDHTSPFPPTN